MVGDNTQLFDGTIKNVTLSLQQLITTQSLLEDISNENKGTINKIGNDYFCESGQYTSSSFKFFTNDSLWDGDGCGSQELQCCSAHPNLPWFHKTFNSSTTDYIELRVCSDRSPASNEDTPVSFYEI